MIDYQTQFFKLIEEKCFGYYKQNAYFHSIQVATLAHEVALYKGLDPSLSFIAGLFHDIAYFTSQSHFDHSTRSADIFLKLKHSLTKEQQDIIYTMIKNHSDKENSHDDYSELLKDVDLYSHFINEPHRHFLDYEQERIQHIQSYIKTKCTT